MIITKINTKWKLNENEMIPKKNERKKASKWNKNLMEITNENAIIKKWLKIWWEGKWDEKYGKNTWNANKIAIDFCLKTNKKIQ